MKFIDEFDIELVNQNLSFDTVDSHVTGTIDLFTTKPVGSDRKLYKTIDKNWDQYLHEQHQLSSNDPLLSPPINKFEFANNNNNNTNIKPRSYSTSNIKNEPVTIKPNVKNESNMSRSFHTNGYISPSSLTDNETCVFGPLHQTTSRRTFAYLIGILNTCYPDHDFSSLNPEFFTLIDSSSVLISIVNNLLISLGKSEQDLNWIWDIINGHMDLNECVCFELDNSFVNEEILNNPSVLWCNFYFLYNKKRKRVAFLQMKSTFIQARRGSLLTNNFSKDQLNSSENEYDLTNDVDEDAIMDDDDDEQDDDGDDIVGDLEF